MTAVTLIDSPVANVANIARALRAAGATVTTTNDPQGVRDAQKLVLPGVGSFGAAMSWIEQSGISDALRDAIARGTPLLGICVGHQMLFDSSDEMGVRSGLGIIAGAIRRIDSALPIPQIGWNRIRFNGNPLFDGIATDTPFYFVNSYVATGVDDEIAVADYGVPFTAAVQRSNVFGVQFHPEKSSTAGLRVLTNYVRI